MTAAVKGTMCIKPYAGKQGVRVEIFIQIRVASCIAELLISYDLNFAFERCLAIQ